MSNAARGTPVIATISTDDEQMTVRFDCRGWLGQASDIELLDLHEEKYRHESADVIGLWAADHLPPVRQVFEYLERYLPRNPITGDLIGFEVVVAPKVCELWIRTFRPHLIPELDGVRQNASFPCPPSSEDAHEHVLAGAPAALRESA